MKIGIEIEGICEKKKGEIYIYVYIHVSKWDDEMK